jgi:hypothetical protein
VSRGQEATLILGPQNVVVRVEQVRISNGGLVIDPGIVETDLLEDGLVAQPVPVHVDGVLGQESIDHIADSLGRSTLEQEPIALLGDVFCGLLRRVRMLA